MAKRPERKLEAYQPRSASTTGRSPHPRSRRRSKPGARASNLFRLGAAGGSIDEPDIVAATMASPGIVLQASGRLRRPTHREHHTTNQSSPTIRPSGKPKPNSNSKSKPKVQIQVEAASGRGRNKTVTQD